ncbi:MAG: LysR family transcriptional regulator, partial [Bacillus sp. (in: firmicutes)]
MTLQQLKYVIEVARCRSISQAAQNLFISQPSLSNALKELEKEMGITIFSRTNKGIIITTEGSEFLGYARQVVEQAELLENRYTHTQSKQQHFSVSAQHYAFA